MVKIVCLGVSYCLLSHPLAKKQGSQEAKKQRSHKAKAQKLESKNTKNTDTSRNKCHPPPPVSKERWGQRTTWEVEGEETRAALAPLSMICIPFTPAYSARSSQCCSPWPITSADFSKFARAPGSCRSGCLHCAPQCSHAHTARPTPHLSRKRRKADIMPSQERLSATPELPASQARWPCGLPACG